MGNVTTHDLTRYAIPEDCPLCSSVIWRALAVDLGSIAYYVLLDPAGEHLDTYRPPPEDLGRPGWPRYEPVAGTEHVRLVALGPLWAHSCFVPVNVGGRKPENAEMAAGRRREASRARARASRL